MSTVAGTESVRTEAMNDVLANNWWAVAIRGVLAILFGIIAFAMPGITMLSLVIVYAAYSLVDGVLGIIAAVRGARRGERWGWLLLNGILGVAVAAISVLWPGLTVLAFVLLVAAWALVSGAFMVISAFRLKRDHGRIWLGLAGIATFAFGVLLVIAPLIGAVVLTFWIGAHALILGVMLLVLAWKLEDARRLAEKLVERRARGVVGKLAAVDHPGERKHDVQLEAELDRDPGGDLVGAVGQRRDEQQPQRIVGIEKRFLRVDRGGAVYDQRQSASDALLEVGARLGRKRLLAMARDPDAEHEWQARRVVGRGCR